jgi:hypothetical protein
MNHVTMTLTSDAHFAAGKVPSNPLQDMKQIAQTKHLCDDSGFRLANVHWTFVISCCSKFDEVMRWIELLIYSLLYAPTSTG